MQDIHNNGKVCDIQMTNDNGKVFTAGAYVRLSKKRLLEYQNNLRQNEDIAYSDSIVNQKLLINDYIKRRCSEIALYKFYIDDGFSGLDFERPAFNSMMEDIRKGLIDLVIVKDTSRLGREFILTNNIIQRILPSLNVRYISILDDYDSFNGNTNEEMLMFKSLSNDFYTRDISRKVKGSFTCKMASGQYIGSFAPYGYNKKEHDKNSLVIDDEVAPVVRKIFEMYLAGMGKQTIAQYLTSEGIPTPYDYKMSKGFFTKKRDTDNNFWSSATIRNILKSRVYIGDLVQHKSCSNFRLRKRVAVSPDSYVISESTHEPIIDIETFTKVQEVIKQRARILTKSSKGEISMYAGKLFCGDCSRALSRSTSGDKTYFRCSTYKHYGKKYCTTHCIRLDILNNVILQAIKFKIQNVLQEKERVDITHVRKSKLSDRQISIREDISKLEIQLPTLLNRRKVSFMSFADGVITQEQFSEFNNSITKEIESTQNTLMELKAELTNDGKLLKNFDTWYNSYIKYKDITEINRNIIVDLINRIDVYNSEEGLKINVCFKFVNPINYGHKDNVDTVGLYNKIIVLISESPINDKANNNNMGELEINNYPSLNNESSTY